MGMKEKEDFVYIPKLKYNDILNTGNNISGQAIITKKNFFILPEKEQDPIGMVSRNLYDSTYFNKVKEDFSQVDIVSFETELISILPPRYVIPITNIESFDVSVGFFIFGGLKLKRKGERKASVYIGNTANRKLVKEFYEKI